MGRGFLSTLVLFVMAVACDAPFASLPTPSSPTPPPGTKCVATLEAQWRAPQPELSGQWTPFCLSACAYINDGAPGTRELAIEHCEILDALARASVGPDDRFNTAGKLCRVCEELGF